MIFSFPATSHAGILMKAVGAVLLEGTVFTSMHTLMAAERSHRDPKWERQVDSGSVLFFLPSRQGARGVSDKLAALTKTTEKC